MNRFRIGFLFFLIGIRVAFGQSAEKTVAVLVSSDIYSGTQAGIATFVSDLQKEKYNVVVQQSSMTTPEEVRSYLQGLYSTASPRLVGAILVGNIPYAWQFFVVKYTNPNLKPDSMNCISLQFYSDLNGTFVKNNPKYPSSYSFHTGDTLPEIWIGVLPMYNKTIQQTIDKVNWYFQKNHEYRTGVSTLTNGCLIVEEFFSATTRPGYDSIVDLTKKGPYSWKPFVDWGKTSIYIPNTIGMPSPSDAFNEGLASSQHKVALLNGHGTWSVNGSLTISMAKTISILPCVVWLEGCNTGNLNYENILTEILYSARSRALVAKGGTTFAGGLGNSVNGYYGQTIAGVLLQGKSFGEAVLSHFQTPLAWPWSTTFEMYNAVTIFVGDPTVTLFPKTLSAVASDPGTPVQFNLQQNYPNPFNPSTTIRFGIPKSEGVSIKVFNALGQVVETLVDENREPGTYQIEWNAGVPSGIYFYRLQAGEYVETKKMMVLR